MSVEFHHQPGPCLLCGSRETSRSRLIKGYIIVDCARCGLRYVLDRVPEPEIMRYYQYEYFHDSGDPTNGYEDYFRIRTERERTFSRYLKIVLPQLGRREEVLDIGCGAGYFLNAAKPHFRNLSGVDVSPDALARADASYKLVCSEFRSELYPRGHADLIMLSDVIEHLYHPVEFLRQVKEVLHPDGLVCIITPNRKSALARISGRRYVSYKLPEHVSYFDPTTLGRTMEEAGLCLRSWRGCGQYATVDFVAKRLSSLFFDRRDALRPPPFLRGRMVYVNTGSMLALAGHKTT
jgi:SAM-dependent methyltransferase